MKLLLAVVGFALLASHGINADKALADKLKPYEAFSPYEWTKWVELRPPQGPQPMAVASVSFNPYGYQQAAPAPVVEDSDEDSDSDEDVALEVASPFDQWFKRAIMPQPPVTKKPKKLKDPSATKKPSIVAVPLDFWGPPPSIAPNVTFPPPPGYYAAKKSMFISKLFAALAASVLNETGPIAPVTDSDDATTTISPRQAILDEIQKVLLSDVARSLPADDDDTDSDETEESDEDSDEVPATIKLTPTQKLAALRLAAVKAAAVQPAPAQPAAPTTTTTENPFLLKKLDFLEKLTAAVLAQPTAPLAPIPTKPAPVVATTPAPYTGKPVKGGKAGKKVKGKKAPATPKPPKYLKYMPTTTTTVAPPEIDYDALAQALLSGSGK